MTNKTFLFIRQMHSNIQNRIFCSGMQVINCNLTSLSQNKVLVYFFLIFICKIELENVFSYIYAPMHTGG